ncbi:uncharacterized protein AMSG_11640 [Thecamonas trahens ATCC 50062]|uniref:Uncharacterized protein n=1 Tax=Thecamonas trahens ATCC 50062 TaxID=461836 RepID=A0A0L0DJD4_THETB|nr:hypothetical protein AMSG_11640 [Thecamonas trahens ATCC 50062]KNC52315.1 hypothetical protein AMSG_11640 [Thecamonas trahens ATCC 50062]|eukprot:XP_013762336.1 hypothetical protein AMSG_11640 [Thecamonas trahens ATCC 50062]
MPGAGTRVAGSSSRRQPESRRRLLRIGLGLCPRLGLGLGLGLFARLGPPRRLDKEGGEEVGDGVGGVGAENDLARLPLVKVELDLRVVALELLELRERVLPEDSVLGLDLELKVHVEERRGRRARGRGVGVGLATHGESCRREDNELDRRVGLAGLDKESRKGNLTVVLQRRRQGLA